MTFAAEFGMRILGSLCREFGFLAGQVSIARTDAVKNSNLISLARCLRSGTKIKTDVLPRIAALRLEAETGRWLIAAMHHAVLTAHIPGHAVDHAVFLPLHFLQQLGVTGIM